jgi:hypothetical protein
MRWDMTTLNMTVTTQKMPHTSEFFAVVKAVEHFYYALLFSTDASYAGRTEPWTSWIEQGFSAAIRQAPPETGEMDKLTTSVRSDGKLIEMTASSLNGEVLDKLARLLAAVDSHRVSTGSAGANDAPASKDIQEQLLVPVSEALRKSGLDSRDSNAITEVLQKGLRALTYRDVDSIKVSAGMAVAR